MVYHKSPYPDPPPLPEGNAHFIFLGRPDTAGWPDYPLHIDPETDSRVMRSEFLARVNHLATGLGAPPSEGGLGLQADNGEIIGIMGQTSTEYITTLHACLRIAVPFALISSYSTAFELKHALVLSNVTRLFVDAKFLPLLLPVALACGLASDRIYVLRDATSGPGVKESLGRKGFYNMIAEVKAKQVPEEEMRDVSPDALAYLVFSSGTSGLPKAVMISHGNLVYSVAQALVLYQVSTEAMTLPPAPTGVPVTLGVLPLHHTFGLHSYAFRAFLAPNTLVLLPQWDIELALRSIPKYKVFSLSLIPSLVHQLVTRPGIEKVDLSTLRTMISGAAYLPPELHKKMKSLVPKETVFHEGYGMSEATIAAITQPVRGALGGKLQPIIGCTGVLLPGMEARIVREDGSDADINEPGEMWLRSKNVALGYYNNQRANQETFVDGWLRTGDRFRVDENGYFWFADRAKDTLKISGAQVSPVEIENCLIEHPKKLITDATVAGVSGGRTSDEKIPRAWVVLSEAGRRMTPSQVIKELDVWHRQNLSKYKHLRGGIEIVAEIPKNPSGKTLRRILQDQYEKRVKHGQAKL